MKTPFRTLATAAFAAVLAMLTVTMTATAGEAATLPRDTVGITADVPIASPIDTQCTKRAEPGVDVGGTTEYRVGVMCDRIGDGVQVRVVLVHNYSFDSVGDWQSTPGVWHTVSSASMWDNYRIEFRADPNGGSAKCTATIEKVYDRTFGYDDHAVKMTCSHIPNTLEVRGGADFTAQSDVHTPWITETGITVWSPGQQRTVPAMPVAFTEFRLRGW